MENDKPLPAADAGQRPCEYTPGPWVIDGLFDADTGVDILAVEDPSRREDGVKICEVLPFVEDWTELEIANAHLIAAAPELLEALKAVWNLIECGQLRRNTSDDANPDFAMRQIPFVMALKAMETAIAKAEGRLASATPQAENEVQR
jgi:hypothetical protein